jgi:hypothetical protein
MKMKLTSVVVAIATCAIVSAAPPKGDEKGKGPRGGGRPIPKEMLEKFDKDKDGKISAEERKAAMEEGKAAMEARRAEIMAKFDKDGDGKLNEEERKAAGEARKAEMMKKFDKDGDGELSKEERAEMMKNMPKRGRFVRPGGNGRKGGPEGRGKGKGGPRKGGKPAGE